jgi:arylsulfatase
MALIAGALAITAQERPNIVVLMVDDMGYSDLGCYGSEIRTPHLDRLASEGIRYTQFYNTSKCWTTRISLLTGVYHNRSGRGFEHTAMVSEVLGPAGYKTWWSGKHHATFDPRTRGFNEFQGFLGGAINCWNPGGKTARPGEPEPGWASDYAWIVGGKEVKPFVPEKDFFATDDFTDWAIEWMDKSKDDPTPFFLFVAYNAPHWPLHAHKEDVAKYKGVYDGGYGAIRRARYKRQAEMGLFPKSVAMSEPEFGDTEWQALSPEERRNESIRMEVHAAMVDRVDQNVGRLVKALKQQGKLDNTLILFLVDNGASAERPRACKVDEKLEWGSVGTFNAIGRQWALACNTPLRFWKTTSHEGGICTPMIAHWPKGISAKGSINRSPAHLVDLLPTWMELAGEKARYPGSSKQEAIPPIDGSSIAATFTGETITRARPMFFAYGGGRGVRQGNWKLVSLKGKPWELYDLSKDRTEMKNLADAHPERVAALRKLFDSWIAESSPSYSTKLAKKPKKKK